MKDLSSLPRSLQWLVDHVWVVGRLVVLCRGGARRARGRRGRVGDGFLSAVIAEFIVSIHYW